MFQVSSSSSKNLILEANLKLEIRKYPVLMNLVRTLLRLTLGKRLAITAGELRVAGLESPVTIRRDRFGIPMIEAASEHDAFFALGFCHAQDRAGQLEALLRIGRGTISELAGSRALSVDRISRRIGFRHAAEQQWAILPEASRRFLSAYTEGINAGYIHGLRRRPHEFVVLGISPTPWEPADVLAYMKLQPWFMSSNWDAELARLRILLADGPEALKALDPLSVHDSSLITHRSSLLPLDRLEQDIAALLDVMPLGGGSNNWVIAPSRTTTGRPILCNDPHLAAQLPAPWYLVSIRTPDWAVCGASFVGSPAVPCGHNGYAAWGVTAGLTDNTDLFLEELRREGDTWQYRQGDRWLPCEVRREEIRIKRSQPIIEEVLSTSRGPIINPVLNDAPEALSLRAVWLDPLPLDGWLSAMRAQLRGVPFTVSRVARLFDEPRLCRHDWQDRLAARRSDSSAQAWQRHVANGRLGRPQWLGTRVGAIRADAVRRRPAGGLLRHCEQPAGANLVAQPSRLCGADAQPRRLCYE